MLVTVNKISKLSILIEKMQFNFSLLLYLTPPLTIWQS